MAGRLLLVFRLAWRDARRHVAEGALLLLALTAAATTLTVGLVLNGVTSEPFENTRSATAGPDVVASLAPARPGAPADVESLSTMVDDPAVADHSGPYPYTQATVEGDGVTATAWVQGRDTAPASVDQPALTDGSWVRDGGAVVEAGFAEALGIVAGDEVVLSGHEFEVIGIAVTAAAEPYPKVCLAPCLDTATIPEGVPEEVPPPADAPAPTAQRDTATYLPGPSGLIWVSDADVRGIVTAADALAYVVNIRLSDPAGAAAFAKAHRPDGAAAVEPDAPRLVTWQHLLAGHDHLLGQKRVTLVGGSWLLGLLALASITVLVGGRMAAQLRRVGLIKAVGGTPRLIAVVLLAEHVSIALLASLAGLMAGRLSAPRLGEPGASLVGEAGEAGLNPSTVVVVTAVALGIAAAATLIPVVGAARTSTIRALADTGRPPRRIAWLIELSTRLPVFLLLASRVAAQRPGRTALGVIGIAITVTGVVAALAGYAHRQAENAPGSDPRATAMGAVLVVVAIVLVAQAAVNAICIAWSTTLDTRRPLALARALGATPGQIAAGLAAAQVLPALAGAVLGLAGGIGLAGILDEDRVTIPPAWQLVTVVLGCVALIGALTALPARIGARRSPMDTLQAELT